MIDRLFNARIGNLMSIDQVAHKRMRPANALLRPGHSLLGYNTA